MNHLYKTEDVRPLSRCLEPRLLTNYSRLKEIYHLRVTAWEHSDKGDIINHQLFPNGWYNALDDEALHWAITNEEDEIIAAARLNIFNYPEAFPYYKSMKNLNIPDQMPLGFFSRLVIHPQYQGLCLSKRLISVRVKYCERNKIQWLQALVTRDCIKNLLTKMNFKNIGQIHVSYHKQTPLHPVNVFIKKYHYDT